MPPSEPDKNTPKQNERVHDEHEVLPIKQVGPTSGFTEQKSKPKLVALDDFLSFEGIDED
jgi:hypothetical protein